MSNEGSVEMDTATEWPIRVNFATVTPHTEEQSIDLVGNLAEYGAVGGIARDGLTGEVTLTINARTLPDALVDAMWIVGTQAESVIGDIAITGAEPA
jgi:hypothetical protein